MASARTSWLALLVTGAATAAQPAAPIPAAARPDVDAELLEFLGSVDEEEEDWQQYLEERPIRAAGKPVEKQPVSRETESKPSPKQVKTP